MSEPNPLGSAQAADALSGLERDARVEQLLLQGLDHYFAGDYDQAIHVWTRVLFLDRGHTRARAYIERARSALAERQRKSEQLLHEGVAAFDRGDAGAARAKLTAAVQHGVAPDVALSYLGRLDRLAPPAGSPAGGQLAPASDRPREAPVSGRAGAPRHRIAALVAGLAVLAALAVWLTPALLELGDVRDALRPPRVSAGPPVTELDPLPLPRPAELALERARERFARGHPLDALRLLHEIGVADPLRADADRLRAEIQRQLLETAPATPGSRR